MFEAVGDHPLGECLDLRPPLFRGRAVRDYTGKLDDLGDPATVFLPLDLDVEGHSFVDIHAHDPILRSIYLERQLPLMGAPVLIPSLGSLRLHFVVLG